ncbi:MAG: hypothetical protein FWB73_00465 [Treponema sp.]|nr:hypothetical protein [Treponema sp.]
MSDNVNEKIEEKKASPKQISFFAMILSGAWIAVLSLVKAFWGVIGVLITSLKEVNFGLTVGDIVFSGVMLAAVFSPIYFSIILDKVKEIKLGG